MKTKPHLHIKSKIGRLWDWLVTPSPTIQKPEQRRRARLLAAALSFLLPLYVIPEAVRAILTGNVPYHFWITTLLLTGAYIISRTRTALSIDTIKN